MAETPATDATAGATEPAASRQPKPKPKPKLIQKQTATPDTKAKALQHKPKPQKAAHAPTASRATTTAAETTFSSPATDTVIDLTSPVVPHATLPATTTTTTTTTTTANTGAGRNTGTHTVSGVVNSAPGERKSGSQSPVAWALEPAPENLEVPEWAQLAAMFNCSTVELPPVPTYDIPAHEASEHESDYVADRDNTHTPAATATAAAAAAAAAASVAVSPPNVATGMAARAPALGDDSNMQSAMTLEGSTGLRGVAGAGTDGFAPLG
jgi:hypothetical protein